MLTALLVAATLTCKPMPFPPAPPPVTTACEGADRVQRNHDGIEIDRAVNACTTVRCEGTDQVRRTYSGAQVSRRVNACTVARCEGSDFVVRTYAGQRVSVQPWRCAPPPPRVAPANDPLRFGLTYR